MITASLNREYATRMIGVGAILLGLAVWSLYDGAIAWPRANANLAKVRQILVDSCKKGGVTPEAWLATAEDRPGTFLLKEVFAKEGLPLPRSLVMEVSEITHPEGNSEEARRARAKAAAELFSRDLYPSGKCRGQFVQAAVLILLALLAFRAVWAKRGIEYSVDDAGLSGSGFGKAPIPWADVTSVDWSRWDAKGIVAVVTTGGKRHVLDGWHFRGVRDIVAELEKRFPREGK